MHRQTQNLDCAGCQTRFTTAAALIFHIEQDDCRVIRRSDFQIQRAERQLEKDAWISLNETSAFGLAQTSPRQPFQGQDNDTPSFMNDDPTPARPGRTLQTAIGGPISTASLQQFPPLNSTDPATIPANNHSHDPKVAPSDLIDLNSVVVDMKQLHMSPTILDRSPQSTKDTAKAAYKVEGWLNQTVGPSTPPQDDYNNVASIYDQKVVAVDENTKPEHTNVHSHSNSNGRHSHITTQRVGSAFSASTVMGEVERFWDAVQQQYLCPGYQCNRKFHNARDFREHLLTSVHAGGVVVCPTCLKRFKTTAAWVSHTESASKKCDIRNSADFNTVMREITGGLLGTAGQKEDGTVNFVAPRIQQW